jgi:hypothetical protein
VESFKVVSSQATEPRQIAQDGQIPMAELLFDELADEG